MATTLAGLENVDKFFSNINHFWESIAGITEAIINIAIFVGQLIDLFNENASKITELIIDVINILFTIVGRFAELILSKTQDINDIITLIVNVFIKVFDKLLSNLDDVLSNFTDIETSLEGLLESAGLFISDLFNIGGYSLEFFVELFDSFGKFIQILPKFINNNLLMGVKLAEVGNEVIYWVPAFLIFFTTTWALRKVQEKKNTDL